MTYWFTSNDQQGNTIGAADRLATNVILFARATDDHHGCEATMRLDVAAAQLMDGPATYAVSKQLLQLYFAAFAYAAYVPFSK
jgi:hypothetical protein